MKIPDGRQGTEDSESNVMRDGVPKLPAAILSKGPVPVAPP